MIIRPNDNEPFFYDLSILEARADIQKYFRLFFGSNENFKICFRD